MSEKGRIDCYRYGFNGMEKDDELKGAGNSYDFGARILDPRLGRWLTRDPLERKYPFVSTYAFVNNNPICYVDPDGKKILIHYLDSEGKSQYYEYGSGLKPPDDYFVMQTIVALEYLSEVPEGKDMVDKLTGAKQEVTITNHKEGEEVTDASQFGFMLTETTDKEGKLLEIGQKTPVRDIRHTKADVYWDPNSSVAFNDGKLIQIGDDGDVKNIMNASLSPATCLGHELGHSIQAFFGTIMFELWETHPVWKDTKEEFTITLYEHPIAEVLCEGIRPRYSMPYLLIKTSGPTSNEPLISDLISTPGTEVNLSNETEEK